MDHTKKEKQPMKYITEHESHRNSTNAINNCICQSHRNTPNANTTAREHRNRKKCNTKLIMNHRKKVPMQYTADRELHIIQPIQYSTDHESQKQYPCNTQLIVNCIETQPMQYTSGHGSQKVLIQYKYTIDSDLHRNTTHEIHH